jgi:hypothetical protein
MERMREFMQMAMQTVQQMELVHDDSSVTITYLNQPALTLATNGKKWKQETDQGTEIEYKAEWKNEELRVERKIDGGGTIKERFLLSPAVDQLFVIPGGGGPRPSRCVATQRSSGTRASVGCLHSAATVLINQLTANS